MIIRYIVAMALRDKTLRKRVTERVNLFFEEKSVTRPGYIVRCCSECEYKDGKGKDINAHRSICPKYQEQVRQRIEKLMPKMVIKA
jgi:hypothetical protein